MARRYTRKEIQAMIKVTAAICCLLCFLIFDNWLGMTLSRNNLLPSYTGSCTKYLEMRIPLRRGNVDIYYDFYMDNGSIYSAPEDALKDAGVLPYELPGLIGQEITVSYYPGIIPFPPARLVSAFAGDREIVSAEITMKRFSDRITALSMMLILFGIPVFLDLLTKFFQSPFWQRCRPRIRKALRSLIRN